MFSEDLYFSSSRSLIFDVNIFVDGSIRENFSFLLLKSHRDFGSCSELGSDCRRKVSSDQSELREYEFRLTDDQKPNDTCHDCGDGTEQTRGDRETKSIVL